MMARAANAIGIPVRCRGTFFPCTIGVSFLPVLFTTMVDVDELFPGLLEFEPTKAMFS